MNLVVGNRVIYEFLPTNTIHTVMIGDEGTLRKLSDKSLYKIKKVEACNWEVIEFVEE